MLVRRMAPLVAAVASTLLLVPALVATASPAAAGPEVRRLAGSDRHATAVAVSQASHPDGAPVAVVTTGSGFADALAGGPAASVLGGPVLLVARDRAPEIVLAELRRLRPQRVLVLGGTAAVSDAVTTQLHGEGFAVERLAGSGRYETAARISQRAFAPGPEVVYLATGASYPDALAGAAAAGAAKAPVLLVGKDVLPPATATELRRLMPRRVVVLGGTAAVSSTVESALRNYAPQVSRIAGADRYATAAAVARSYDRAPGRIFLATGQGFADALTGGPAAAAVGGPVLLVPPTCIPSVVEQEMSRHGFPPVTLLGGTSVLGPEVAELEPCPAPGTEVLARGVHLTRIDDPRGPWKGHVVTIAPSAVNRLDTVLAQDALPGYETTSSMARRTRALVAINGDYTLPGGRPVHPFARNGRLMQTEQVFGNSASVEFGRLRLGPTALRVTLAVPATGNQAVINKVNSGPAPLALTTAEGGVLAPVPGASCAARIRPLSAAAPAGDRTSQRYEVREVRCGADPLPSGDDVLTAPLDGVHAPLLRALQPGQALTVSWSLGSASVLDTIGGNPRLLLDGEVAAGNVDGATPYFARNPRTAIGHRADGTVLLVTVDGRGAGGSAGMSLRELAELFVRLGAVDAMNLDGGGSTTMVVGGQVRNATSDGPERPVGTALVLLRDDLALAPASVEEAPALSGAEQAVAEHRMAVDPASTGGLLEAYGADQG
jgi:putative cell wall-binding protein